MPPADVATREEIFILDLVCREAAIGVTDVEELVRWGRGEPAWVGVLHNRDGRSPPDCPHHRASEGFSCREVVRVCHAAAELAAHESQLAQQQCPQHLGVARVTMDHFAVALRGATSCTTHASAISFLKWKGQLASLH